MIDWNTLLRSRDEIFGEWYYYSCCRWCGTELEFIRDSDLEGRFTSIQRRNCPSCGWWDTDAFLPAQLVAGEDYWYSIHRRAILKEFDISSAKVPVADLARHVARHPASVYKIEPYKLEELVAGIFTRTMECQVQWLGGPGDGGIDLLLVHGESTFAVQVKRMSSAKHPVRVSAVREFVGAMVIEGVAKGIFVTTSSFTRPAEQSAFRAVHRPGLERIELVDGDRLVRLCGLAEWPNSSKVAAENYEQPLYLHHLRDGFSEFYHSPKTQ